MTEEQKERYAAGFAVHVGVDTGKAFHKLVAMGPDGRRTKAVRVDVSRAGFEAANEYLTSTFPDVPRERMLVALEFAGHQGFTFAHFLARRGYEVVSVLPAVTKALKKVEDNSPQKDDAKDAAQICSTVGQGYYVTFPLLDDRGAELRTLATERHRLSVEETRLKNRLHAVLDLAWPEFAAQFALLVKPTALTILAHWPLPADLVAASPRRVRAVARESSRNHFGPERLARLFASARESVGVTSAPDARRSEICRILARLQIVREHTVAVEASLAVLVADHPGARALTTVPQISAVCAATLVAELGSPETYVSPRQVLKLAGMNLAKKESGTSVRGRVRQTKRGRPLLRRQLFLLAGRWCSTKGLYREEYLALKTRNGGSQTSAMCAIARRLVPMLLRLMQSGEAFDEVTWRTGRVKPAGASLAGAPASGAGPGPYRDERAA